MILLRDKKIVRLTHITNPPPGLKLPLFAITGNGLNRALSEKSPCSCKL